jgi:hypothetical protein
VHEPAEHERRSERHERDELRHDRSIRRRDTCEGLPVRRGQQGGQQWQRQHDGSGARPDERADGGVDAAPDRALAVEGDGDRAAGEHEHVEHQQVIQKPQVREWKGACGRRRHVGRRRGQCAAERLRESPDPDRRQRGRQHEPADDQRNDDALRAVRPEAARALPVQHHPGEEAGDEEEQRHPEDVRREAQGPERRARGRVRDDPQAHGYAGREREAGVEHDAEQQRERPDGVERMEAIGHGHHTNSVRRE